jgi:hypothetical protein
MRQEQALIDALPAEMKQVVWEFGFGAIDPLTLRRHAALERKKARGERPRAYVAPVIKMPN